MDELPKVVTAPIKFDATKAREVGDQLRAALGSRSVVIADLTQTWTCDLAAIGELCMAHQIAASSGRELRIVATSETILRQFARAGLDAELPIYSSLSVASRPAPDPSAGSSTRDGD
jgi:anti-anti-sigma regulatory factor